MEYGVLGTCGVVCGVQIMYLECGVCGVLGVW